ncbi:hypothetical protein [Allosphingosinicella sp.]|uniref:hypothetical protein n=1 Tax=Allosphingosinicella sp. TaxID=2823234 RepID=UPI0037843E2D
MRLPITLAACGLALLAAAPAQAALAPNYQRLAELRAVLDLPAVGSAFGIGPVDRIDYVATDLYRLSAGRCSLDVRIVDLPMPRGMVGARRFEGGAGRRVCGR